MKILLLSLFSFALLLAHPLARAEAIVVVTNSPGSVTIEELRNIYFQNGGRLSSGQVVEPIDYKEDNPVRDQFYERAFERSRVQMKAYWAQRIFTGKGNPPRTVENAKEAKAMIDSDSTSFISYMNESELSGDLSVLLRLP